jgi:hypothetical protein
MKTILSLPILAITGLLLFLTDFCAAQEKHISKYEFSSEIIPLLYLTEDGAGDGYQVGLARDIRKGRYKVKLTYGSNKYTYQLSGVYGITIGGMPVFIKKADENIFTPRDERVEGVPDESLFELLENAGIKHFKPDDGAITTNYGTVEIIRNTQLWQLYYNGCNVSNFCKVSVLWFYWPNRFDEENHRSFFNWRGWRYSHDYGQEKRGHFQALFKCFG